MTSIGTERADRAAGLRVPLTQIGRESPAVGLLPPRAPQHVHDGGRMVDSHGRAIRDLRISITDRCNFRCVYCMEPDVRFAPKDSVLTPAEFVRVARVACTLGVRKIRITGGEPTLHPELERIISGIREATSAEIAMITNGSLLTRAALRVWKAAGLGRITLSIDSLRHDRYARLTRSSACPEAIIAGIEACLAEGLVPLKLNAVLLRGFNDEEAVELAALARHYGVEMRFIEYMPLDSGGRWDASRWISAAQTREQIERRYPLVAREDDGAGTARIYDFADGSPGRIGFIAPISSPFCGACSRLRVTADGHVRPCLFSQQEWDIRPLLRSGARDGELAEFLIDATWTKRAGHGIGSADFNHPQRPMSAIGG